MRAELRTSSANFSIKKESNNDVVTLDGKGLSRIECFMHLRFVTKLDRHIDQDVNHWMFGWPKWIEKMGYCLIIVFWI